jgi:hypothetical protein
LSNSPSSPPPAPVAANASVQLVVSPSNGLATSGFVVSLIAAVFSIIPIIGVISWVLAPIGIILSGVGLSSAKKSGVGQGLSIAGLVLGIAALIICILWVVAVSGSSATAG